MRGGPEQAAPFAVAFAAAVGISFGYYPPRKAAQLEPVEARPRGELLRAGRQEITRLLAAPDKTAGAGRGIYHAVACGICLSVFFPECEGGYPLCGSPSALAFTNARVPPRPGASFAWQRRAGRFSFAWQRRA